MKLYILFDYSEENAADKILDVSFDKAEIIALRGHLEGGARELEIIEKDAEIDLYIF